MASFTKWDTLLSGTLQAGPMSVPLREVLLYTSIYVLYEMVLVCLGPLMRLRWDNFYVIVLVSPENPLNSLSQAVLNQSFSGREPPVTPP